MYQQKEYLGGVGYGAITFASNIVYVANFRGLRVDNGDWGEHKS
jgi:hypothetical protein